MHIANTLKTAVACALLGAVVATASASGAHAQPQYDTKLAKFMADKAAGALGDLRTGFALDETPDLSHVEPDTGYGIHETLRVDGMELLTPRVDATTTGSIAPEIELMPRKHVRVVYAG
ncbi:MAG: hypothetical protein WAU86_07030 [Oricola sp.]